MNYSHGRRCEGRDVGEVCEGKTNCKHEKMFAEEREMNRIKKKRGRKARKGAERGRSSELKARKILEDRKK